MSEPKKDDVYKKSVEFVQFVLDAMHKQRERDADVIAAFAAQLTDDHPAKKPILQIADIIRKQSV